MYDLFLCLRYLRRRYLALIAVLAVALCVAMVLIVVSVMDGFLHKVETAAKGVFGDIIVDASSLSGIARYDEFIATLADEVPEIEAATPVIYSYGLLRIGPTYTEAVQICGVRMPERLAVTDFANGLFIQEGNRQATFDPPIDRVIARTREHMALIDRVHQTELDRPPDRRDNGLLEKLTIAAGNAPRMARLLERSKVLGDRVSAARAALSAEEDKPPAQRNAAEIERLADALDDARIELDRTVRGPDNRLILGVGIAGLSFRTPDGDTIRTVTPGRKIVLTLLPVGRGFLPTTITPNTRTFTAIDDVKTEVYTIDSKFVYVPFETLQILADMDARQDMDDPSSVDPARCSQIQIKVKPAYTSDARLVAVRKKVQAAWGRFTQTHRDAQHSVIIFHTWREKLQDFIGPIRKQRNLVTIMFGVISSVSVLLIFAIFYMIVVEKTRDIGVVRAVGGSAAGVARIFLGFGAATGVVGSVLGLTGGWFFVRYINEIQDALASWSPSLRVWERAVFMFDRIPNEVDPSVAVVIAVWAIASGLVGALIPAVRAAVMEPAEAVRYE